MRNAEQPSRPLAVNEMGKVCWSWHRSHRGGVVQGAEGQGQAVLGKPTILGAASGTGKNWLGEYKRTKDQQQLLQTLLLRGRSNEGPAGHAGGAVGQQGGT